jgi:molecular chaperone GrpE
MTSASDTPVPDPEAPAPADTGTQTAGDEGALLSIPRQEFETLTSELATWKDRCIRSQAEFENIRKRLRKEADEAGTRAIVRFVRPILTELDNLSRALSAATPGTFNEFAQGVTMIEANLKAALAAAGIEPVVSEGVFDPAIHEVLAEAEHADLSRGTIVQVHRPGYKLRDQLVRAAQVVVAKPPAAASGSGAG